MNIVLKNEVADVIRLLGDDIEKLGFGVHQLKTLRAIKDCRTARLGGHVDACMSCGSVKISYNSCRNRHCPKCQGHQRETWIQKREADVLPTTYFHVVFTLPSEINPLCLQQPKIVYDSLFESAWQTIESFGKKKNVQMGMICILHTWGQNLSLHPHLHCIIPGGGVTKNGMFEKVDAKGKYLFSVKALSKVYRAKMIASLRKRNITDNILLESLFKKEWVVYAKRPFGGVSSAIEYLGRYTHKIAIGNSRIKNVDEKNVTFDYKDYKQQGVKREMTLTLQEFTRRLAMHILPHRFVRIRHFGILSSTWKRKKLTALQEQLHVKKVAKNIETRLHKCPCCKTGTLITIDIFGSRGPPKKYLLVTENSACVQ
jgi:Putative transposase/Transposase zinc-binding domain